MDEPRPAQPATTPRQRLNAVPQEGAALRADSAQLLADSAQLLAELHALLVQARELTAESHRLADHLKAVLERTGEGGATEGGAGRSR